MKNYVYEVIFDWATAGESGVDTYLFVEIEKAKEKFNGIIADEKDPDTSWVGDCIVNDKPIEGYELDIQEYSEESNHGYWEFWESGYFDSRHSSVFLKKQEVIE